MNGMTNIAEYGKKSHAQYSEPVFSPFCEKSINFVFAKDKLNSVLYGNVWEHPNAFSTYIFQP